MAGRPTRRRSSRSRGREASLRVRARRQHTRARAGSLGSAVTRFAARPPSQRDARQVLVSDLVSKAVLVTGATDGLGRGVVRALAKKRATVLVHGRDRSRAEGLAEELRTQGAPAVRV